MAGRSRSSFTKRLKERSRQEKAREKAERKVQRKMEKQTGGAEDGVQLEDFSAVEEQWALPNTMQEE
jgi:hypothetical protein